MGYFYLHQYSITKSETCVKTSQHARLFLYLELYFCVFHVMFAYGIYFDIVSKYIFIFNYNTSFFLFILISN